MPNLDYEGLSDLDIITPENIDEVVKDLEDEIEALEDQGDENLTADEIETLTEDLNQLTAFRDDVRSYSAYSNLISEHYFEEFAKDMANDLDLISSDTTWPFTCIDWDQATRELQQDYTAIEFQGVTFYTQ